MTSLRGIEITGVAAGEPRRSDRFPMRSAVRVTCLVTEHTLTAQGLNISAHGMAFVSADPLALGSLLQVALPNCGLSSLVRVRNCEWQDSGWRIGVEMFGSLA